ncbi:hypothetical protein [Allosphingosinicella vermicomposti]|uniref:hypothetical protein n=1 Tax=Allosphingosinicella vermicomposti TaxID=614671 RepID=UPI000D0F4551|nr:hypothetical protein [Allosphingosinicella vermicomposti]
MGPVVYVMAILGCGEADSVCQPIATIPARYESQDACNAAAEDVLARQDDILFPVVVAQCDEEGKPTAGNLMSETVKLPEAREPQLRRARAQGDQAQG